MLLGSLSGKQFGSSGWQSSYTRRPFPPSSLLSSVLFHSFDGGSIVLPPKRCERVNWANDEEAAAGWRSLNNSLNCASSSSTGVYIIIGKLSVSFLWLMAGEQMQHTRDDIPSSHFAWHQIKSLAGQSIWESLVWSRADVCQRCLYLVVILEFCTNLMVPGWPLHWTLAARVYQVGGIVRHGVTWNHVWDIVQAGDRGRVGSASISSHWGRVRLRFVTYRRETDSALSCSDLTLSHIECTLYREQVHRIL